MSSCNLICIIRFCWTRCSRSMPLFSNSIEKRGIIHQADSCITSPGVGHDLIEVSEGSAYTPLWSLIFQIVVWITKKWFNSSRLMISWLASNVPMFLINNRSLHGLLIIFDCSVILSILSRLSTSGMTNQLSDRAWCRWHVLLKRLLSMPTEYWLGNLYEPTSMTFHIGWFHFCLF